MVTALSQLRHIFPAEERTPEQDALIGSSCLALSDIERKCITEFPNASQTYENYVEGLPRGEREEMIYNMLQAVKSGKRNGAIKGAAAGFVAVGGLGVCCGIPGGPIGMGCGAVAGAAAGALGGAYGGYKCAQADQITRFHSMTVGERREVADEMASVVYRSRGIESPLKPFIPSSPNVVLDFQ
jgi:outer membrane lipoprotein SlyB